MSIDPVANVFLQPSAGIGQQLTLPLPGDFSNKLSLGQIIKGRVLRQYEDNRYLVDFGGREQVVDSSIPLQTNEILYGRVVGLGNPVELTRVPSPQTTQNATFENAPAVEVGVFSERTSQLVTELFNRFGGTLTEQNANVLNQALRNSAAPLPLIYAALLLSKLGLPFSLEKLQALNKALAADPRQALFDEKQAIYLSTLPSDAAASLEPGIAQNQELLRLLAELAHATPEDKQEQAQPTFDTPTDTGGEGKRRGGEWPQQYLAHTLLNLQVDGNIHHRIATIPFVIDGELIELNIGFVDQRNAKPGQEETAHHRVVFSLQTQSLGGISIDGVLTGDHLRLKVVVEQIDAIAAFETHREALKEVLLQAGFKVDELRYEITAFQDMPSAPWLALHNVIQSDSLDRWI